LFKGTNVGVSEGADDMVGAVVATTDIIFHYLVGAIVAGMDIAVFGLFLPFVPSTLPRTIAKRRVIIPAPINVRRRVLES
jgi:hypothetical protein